MTGNRRVGMVLQDRDRQLLEELAVMRVIDREQAKTVAGFGSTTRVNTRLLALTRAGLLRRFFLGTSGGDRRPSTRFRGRGAARGRAAPRLPRRRDDKRSSAIASSSIRLAINEIYCALKFQPIPLPGVAFERWLSFDEPIAPSLLPRRIRRACDSRGILAAFLEVDLGHGAAQRCGRRRFESYLQLALSGDFERASGKRRFRVLVIANSERRMHSIRKTVAAVTEKIFWFSTLRRSP